ncbi:MAG: hypothetical protein KKF44_06855, partial [Nanoarchaeota archaeon]|nr:hypothetical protein [Nanoarchaeota archaeon]
MKNTTHYTILVSIVILTLFLTACGGAEEEEPESTPVAEPTIEPTSTPEPVTIADFFGGVNAASRFTDICSEDDYFFKDVAGQGSLFLKLKKQLRVCDVNKDEAVPTQASQHIEDVCDSVFKDGRHWDGSLSFEENFDVDLTDNRIEYRVTGTDLDALDVSECINPNFPREYYRCSEDVYLYREISEIGYCDSGKLRYYASMKDMLLQSDCSPDDYDLVDRWTDGVDYYELNSAEREFAYGYYFTVKTPIMIIGKDNKICNPYGSGGERVDPVLFCDLNPMENSVGETNQYGYCIGQDYRTEAVPFSCRIRNLEDRSLDPEIIIVEATDDDTARYLTWECLGKSSHYFGAKTIAEIYDDFPENCRELGFDYFYDSATDEYDAVVIDSEGMLCSPFDGLLYEMNTFCDSVEESDDPVICLGDDYDIETKQLLCVAKIGDAGQKLQTAVFATVVDPDATDFIWKCNSGYRKAGKKDLIDFYSFMPGCQDYYYYLPTEDFTIAYVKEGKMCCPNSGEIVEPEKCLDYGESNKYAMCEYHEGQNRPVLRYNSVTVRGMTLTIDLREIKDPNKLIFFCDDAGNPEFKDTLDYYEG